MFAIFFFVASNIHAYVRFNPDYSNHRYNSINNNNTQSNGQFRIFNQKLDHFDPTNTKTFKQRYLVNDTYYRNSHTMYLYLNGEAPLRASRSDGEYALTLSKLHKAVLVVLEHRYYGESQPFTDHSTQNLKYLSAKQALADAAHFAEWIKANDLKALQIRKIVVVGGSYAGCLSAWFRMMYPHIAVAAISSSAPVVAKADYFEYDQHIRETLEKYSQECVVNIQKATTEIEEQIATDYPTVQKLLGCEKVSDKVDFLYVIADMVSHSVQYNQFAGPEDKQMIKLLCDTLSQAPAAGKTIKDNMYDFVSKMFVNMDTNCYDFSSSAEILKDTTMDFTKSGRQWTYQTCTEFGYFQVAPAENSLRSKQITLEYHYDLCEKIFGPEFRQPDIEATNAFFGGEDMLGTNIAWVNGAADPWMRLSIIPRTVKGQNGEVKDDGRQQRQRWEIALIENGSHCTDLREPNATTDSQSLVKAREMERTAIEYWFESSTFYTPKWQWSSPSAIFSMAMFGVSLLLLILSVILVIVACVHHKNKRNPVAYKPINP
ncbi:putative Thymus-specific serine protease [Blattamonas nauphoetae]|uniref:Thymus-specific serine protease n=1 Tax=Blattamonas nauphoetae TaxID=2049346 RepID=A0ABQ9XQP1_9EUKA|nr:putative Thymus-specific serine protease [Blattamonas nauphoetae]